MEKGSLRVDMGRTARELGREELRAYRPWQALEDYQRDPSVVARRDRAWHVAKAAADLLKRRFGANRVVVFGSLAKKTMFTPWSDIDLAVWGVAPEEYYIAAGAALDVGLDEGIRMDIVDGEKCSQELQAIIERDGIQA